MYPSASTVVFRLNISLSLILVLTTISRVLYIGRFMSLILMIWTNGLSEVHHQPMSGMRSLHAVRISVGTLFILQLTFDSYCAPEEMHLNLDIINVSHWWFIMIWICNNTWCISNSNFFSLFFFYFPVPLVITLRGSMYAIRAPKATRVFRVIRAFRAFRAFKAFSL